MSIQCHTTVKVRLSVITVERRRRGWIFILGWIERSSSKSRRTRQKHQRPLPAGSRFPFQVRCDVAARCTGSNKSMKEEDSSREGRMRGEAVPAKKINWADVIRSIPTIRLCAAFIHDVCTYESIRSIIVDNRCTDRYMLLSVLFRNGRLLLFDGRRTSAPHRILFRTRLELGSGYGLPTVCIIFFLSRFFPRR